MTWLALCLSPAFALGAVVLWRNGWRWAVIYAGLMAVSIFGAVEIMGRAKPIWAEWRNLGSVEVLGIHYVPDVAIYVWVAGDEPRAYRLPWSEETARQAQEQARKSPRFVMEYDEQSPQFYPMPQMPTPPKGDGR